jgi:hypothetical protein
MQVEIWLLYNSVPRNMNAETPNLILGAVPELNLSLWSVRHLYHHRIEREGKGIEYSL